MPPATGPALIILVAFVLPGFVTVLLQERTFKSADDPTPLDRLLRIVWYSVLSYLLVAVLAMMFGVDKANFLHWYHAHTGDPAQLVWRAALLVVTPAVVIEEATRFWHGSSWRGWVLEILRINARHSEPTGWDHFFRQRRYSHVRVTFADGSRVLGYYGDHSFAAYAKDGQDLYLESASLVDENGWFREAAPHSSGVWIKTGDAVSVEFYTADRDEQETEPSNFKARATARARKIAGKARRTRRAETEPERAEAAAAASSTTTTPTKEDGLEDERESADRGPEGA